ncbi:hypothetical protein EPIR_2683 [Erwinia piriflorinigrans CFBP 5888]|uniref:Uncharacterized protein n=1 Tax=Erwinia piriflorinigrans CFBP 5888 TaxID=1161919 RepID=V5ZAW0_9GAMM|nr:hypothetical protein EPIR_2683 [Erwinia piriflorinigrans CFBP 5888]
MRGKDGVIIFKLKKCDEGVFYFELALLCKN